MDYYYHPGSPNCRKVSALLELLGQSPDYLARSGGFDLMIHFHGHEAVRKEWVNVMDGAVLVAHNAAFDLGFLAAELEEGLEEIATAAARFDRRPRVYFEEWHDPLISGIR